MLLLKQKWATYKYSFTYQSNYFFLLISVNVQRMLLFASLPIRKLTRRTERVFVKVLHSHFHSRRFELLAS